MPAAIATRTRSRAPRPTIRSRARARSSSSSAWPRATGWRVAAAEAEIAAAIAEAERAPQPRLEDALGEVQDIGAPAPFARARGAAMTVMSVVEASRRALAEEMRRDPTVWALGEDLGRGGVFQQYKGLQAEFGPARVCDTPISEAAIMGAAVGAAMCGTRPVVETRYLDFTLCAADELVNQAAKARYMFGGQARVPIVVRQPTGLWMNCAAQHSQSLEAWWAHMPGLVVLAPATPADSYAMMKAAIRADDPVILLEHKELWGITGEVEEGRARRAPRQGAHLPRGRDVTIVSWSLTCRPASTPPKCSRATASTPR